PPGISRLYIPVADYVRNCSGWDVYFMSERKAEQKWRHRKRISLLWMGRRWIFTPILSKNIGLEAGRSDHLFIRLTCVGADRSPVGSCGMFNSFSPTLKVILRTVLFLVRRPKSAP